jgi:hypothetical protein
MLSEEAMERGLAVCRCSRNACKVLIRQACVLWDPHVAPGAQRTGVP